MGNKNMKCNHDKIDRKSVVQGKSVDLGGRRIIKKKKKKEKKRKKKKKEKTDVEREQNQSIDETKKGARLQEVIKGGAQAQPETQKIRA